MTQDPNTEQRLHSLPKSTARGPDVHAPQPAGGADYWYKDAVIYQLHLKSFFDSNNDGIGDFEGLISRLDYIVELGVNTIWLLPFYPSPRRDDGYDISQYRGVHPDYGRLADARRFVAAAHHRGLKVITELVINHTSDQHPWFQRARRAKPGSNARNYYVWSDTNQKYAGTRIIFCDTETSNWTWDEEAGAYYWHRFYSHQPDLNFDNPAVLNEVLGIMKFWLDIGVDGLRLDAVPYLVEREGTANENLPETHAILRRIRAALDAHYPDRMLLAEANMWPEDVRQYFGGDAQGMGDECHMAFHFPLMSRLYMAIAREDRHPITDIMRQTPELPVNCQWAIFLRNHDELTLEQVTTAERDYLWKTYASDPRARINLGIRRRLAPLLDRDRRRIELMNSLLFSMPGTPVIYYGDEIGMGDNIHLGDRDGVRTPMQWSVDRNGGFSRAEPEQMVLPPIQNAVYGYEAVNVEAQSKDPHSLLNWTRRMLALRRRFRAFGRGTLQFLSPGNRRVLVYIREYLAEGAAPETRETILCVANLAHTPQAVELDLGAYAGRVPVEMMGGTAFPSIGAPHPYVLTLPANGFYWFELSATASPPDWHSTDALLTPDWLTLVLHNRMGYELTAGSRTALEREVLPLYLSRRRWFAAAPDARPPAVRVCYAAPVPGVDEVFLAEIASHDATRPPGAEDEAALRAEPHYHLPVSILWDEEENVAGLPRQLAMARVRRGPRIGLLTDAWTLERLARGVVGALRSQARVPLPGAQIAFVGSTGVDDPRFDEAVLRWPTGEPTETSVFFEGLAVLKVLRHVYAGVNPEAEMLRELQRRDYPRVARLLGEVLRVDQPASADEAGGTAGTPHTLMLLESALSNEGDGAAWFQQALSRTVEDAALIGLPDTEYTAHLQGVTAIGRAIGARLAQFHALMAEPNERAEFAPRAATAVDLEAWATRTQAGLEQALARIAGRSDWRTDRSREDAAFVLAQSELLAAWPTSLALAPGAAPADEILLTRIHGDFGLPRVLIALDDVYLIDFAADSDVDPAPRRQLAHGLQDLAGVLQSLEQIVHAVHESGHDLAVTARIEERRDRLHQIFLDTVRDAMIDSYRDSAAEAPVRWYPAAAGPSLLTLFRLEAAVRAILQEAQRQQPLDVPVRILAHLLRQHPELIPAVPGTGQDNHPPGSFEAGLTTEARLDPEGPAA